MKGRLWQTIGQAPNSRPGRKESNDQLQVDEPEVAEVRRAENPENF
jgi:hypothetical protein